MLLPKISIVTPTLNQGKYIERTIRSVLDQQYPNLEYIVIDGGSTDDTIAILRKHATQLKWISEKDRGQADAINKGLKMATGDIVAYLNSDDIYEHGTLNRIARHFAQHPETQWVTGKCRIINEEGREIRKAITAYKNCLLSMYSHSLLLVTNPISQPSTFWRRDLLDTIGFFNEDEHIVMDYEFWLRVGNRHNLAILDDYLACFRVYAETKTSSLFQKGFRRELELAREQSPPAPLYALHWFSYLAISSVYWLFSFCNRIRSKISRTS